MTIDLYTMTSENERITKELGTATTVNGNLLEDTSITDIVLEIEYTPSTNFNYLYVTELNRYYYIKNITITSNQTMLLTCHCDVLMTYRDAILGHSAVIERQENRYNLYLDDSMYRAYQDKKIQFKKLSGAMPTPRCFLMVNGGGIGVTNA